MSAVPSAAARLWAAAGAAGTVSRWRSAAVIALASVAWRAALGGVAVAAVEGVAYRVAWPDFTIGLAYPAVAVLVGAGPGRFGLVGPDAGGGGLLGRQRGRLELG